MARAPASLWLCLGIAASAGGACTTNHDALALRPTPAAGGGGAAGTSPGFGGFPTSGTTAGQGGRPNPDNEPPGDNVLTIVNGVVDAASVRLCFAHLSDDGQTSELVGRPLPELRYAASSVLTSLDGFSFAKDVIVPWVLAGELSLIEQLDCAAAVELAQAEEAKVTPEPTGQGGAGSLGDADADAGGAGGAGGADDGPPLERPTLRARPLAALPAGTVDVGRSILLVLSGCLGGAAFADRVDTAACGADYRTDAPSVEPLIVKLSRDYRYDKVGLQGLHASRATGSIDLRVGGNAGDVLLVFAASLSYGMLAPRPADNRFGPAELGVTQTNFGLEAGALDGSGAVFRQAWPDVYSATGMTTLDDARSYTAIYVGPDLALSKRGFWNPPAFALIDNDPTRPHE